MDDIIIKRGALARAGEYAYTALNGRETGRGEIRAAIISDDIVGALYGGALSLSFERAGFRALRYAFEHGEQSKNLYVYARILDFLSQHHMSRADCVVALGGGVAGDMAGFAAATYLRGIALIHVPTTLLACVDSAIGGKTAINLPAGKNLAGAFYPARLTLIDPDALSSLPAAEFTSGMAEALKYSAIGDAGMLPLILNPRDGLTELIRRCAQMKKDIVARDPFDNGDRQLLNFGHTFGHALEKWSGYRISHGSAVAAGMAIMARACAHAGLCARADAQTLLDALNALNLPDAYPAAPEELMKYIEMDKKRGAGDITLILMRAFGKCERARASIAEARELLAAGCAPWSNARGAT